VLHKKYVLAAIVVWPKAAGRGIRRYLERKGQLRAYFNVDFIIAAGQGN
jgi:hypothetical protein